MQCEICQNITNTKQEFVEHIKDNHRDIVDEEVLNSLERDLQKSKRRADREQKKAAKSPAAKKSPPVKEVKKTPAAKKAEKPKAKAGSKTATPSKSPASRKSKDVTCKVCNAVLAKTSPSEVARHMNSRACRSVAAESKKSGKSESAEAEVDPLDVDTSANGVDDIVGDIVGRTCQYCGKVVEDIKDLPGHYTTKGCVAKKYQNMQNGGEGKGLTSSASIETPVVIDNAEDDSEQIVPNDAESDNRLVASFRRLIC